MLNFSGRAEKAGRAGTSETGETGETSETSGSASRTGNYETSGTGGVQKRDFYLWVKK